MFMSTRNKPVLRNILVNWNAVCSCAAKYFSDWKSRMQRNRALWWLWVVPRSSFSLHTNQKRTICAAGLRTGPQKQTFLRDATATLGPPLSMGRAAVRTTHVLLAATQWQGHWAPPCAHLAWDMALPFTSQPCPPCPYVCPLPLYWKRAWLTDHHTNPNSYARRNDIVPSVKSVCFICGSIFSLLLCGGDGRGGDHYPAGLSGDYKHFSRSGSSSQLPRWC